MKNKEKYAMDIVEIACNGDSISVARSTGKLVPCSETLCRECLFNTGTSSCKDETRKWAESNYIEKSVISKMDREFLDYIMGKYKYIARDKTGYLYVYSKKLDKKRDIFWIRNSGEYFCINNRFNVDFPMVKWEDEEPWFIEDLKRLEVVEEYS